MRKIVKELDFSPLNLCELEHTNIDVSASDFGKANWIQRVEFRKTCVDLHSRGEYSNPKEIVLDEASVLFECRHPNILLMLGFCLAFSKGPVLIMERAWGTLTAALRSGPMPLQPALSIASQVASALLYLHDRGMLHGQVRTNSVFLVSPGSASPGTAKLANFATIKRNAGDRILAGDVLRFGVLLHDLFATNYSGGSPLEQLSELSLEQLKCSISFADLGLLLHSIFRGDVTFAVDIAEWFTEAQVCLDELDEQAPATTQSALDQSTQREVQPSARLLVPLTGSAVQGERDFRPKFSL
jgi:serine/threonine protein kinase